MKNFKFTLIVLTIGLLLFSCSNDDEDNNTVNVYEQFLGNWEGTYSGGDNGTWTASIDDEGVVTGSVNSTTFNQTYDLSGDVSESGAFSAAVGTASTGATFTGQIDGSNVSGTWTNIPAELSGNWDGVAQ